MLQRWFSGCHQYRNRYLRTGFSMLRCRQQVGRCSDRRATKLDRYIRNYPSKEPTGGAIMTVRSNAEELLLMEW